MGNSRILFVKPPDRYLDDEFVYQQLGPHYLQSYLEQYGISSDILVLYENRVSRKSRENGETLIPSESDLDMLWLSSDGGVIDAPFDHNIFGNYEIVGLSVMSPQAPDAYLITEILNRVYPGITTVIGGSHPRYYLDQVKSLPLPLAFDFVVPQDGWRPMYEIATGKVKRNGKSTVLSDNFLKFVDLPPPTRPLELMKKYSFEIAGAPAYHTISALGCPFTCHFCESGTEKVRMFSEYMLDIDLSNMSNAHDRLGNNRKSVMFFDDVGLMNPRQVRRLSTLVNKYKFDSWRAFTHAYLVKKFGEELLRPFIETGGKRVGIGLETGSQRSMDLINKRNGKRQLVSEHYEAVRAANKLGVAVDAFTMIFPWEDEEDLRLTTELIEFVACNKVEGKDGRGRPMYNHVDSTIMTPFQGTKFLDMIKLGKLPDVEVDEFIDPGRLYYKGVLGGSGWPYRRTRLSRERYIEAQMYRNSFRPEYR
jgi:radical SAM superfamily enzyme YgiQ (UPF0313 family)